MIKLIPYTPEFKNDTVKRIADFYNYHSSLLNKKVELTESSYAEAEETLGNWLESSNELYLIKYKQFVVGFLHIGYRGENVAWIEDIYVDKNYRNKGIATQSIHVAEEIIKSHVGYTSICFDVVPRNNEALRLYHKLGYDNLSIITVRKELYENNRNKVAELMGLEFKY